MADFFTGPVIVIVAAASVALAFFVSRAAAGPRRVAKGGDGGYPFGSGAGRDCGDADGDCGGDGGGD